MSANEVGYSFSGVDKPHDDNGLWGLRYAEFVVPLVKAVQEQQTQIQAHQTEITHLRESNLDLETRIQKLEQIVAQQR